MNVDRSWFRSMLIMFGDLRIEHNLRERHIHFILRIGGYEEAYTVRECDLPDPNTYQRTYLALPHMQKRLLALNAAASRLFS